MSQDELKDMNPFEAIELLKELNRQRVKTRKLARTALKPGEVKEFIDRFQEIENTILDEIEKGLGKWYTLKSLELQELRQRILILEQANLQPLLSEDDEMLRAKQ